MLIALHELAWPRLAWRKDMLQFTPKTEEDAVLVLSVCSPGENPSWGCVCRRRSRPVPTRLQPSLNEWLAATQPHNEGRQASTTVQKLRNLLLPPLPLLSHPSS